MKGEGVTMDIVQDIGGNKKQQPGKHFGTVPCLFTDFCQIIGPKSFGHIILLCHLTLGHVNENRVCLQNLIQVFLSGREHIVWTFETPFVRSRWLFLFYFRLFS